MKHDQVFAFVTIGSGSYLGSTVRDLTIANMLHRRGYKVVVYWMLEWSKSLADPGITHRLLCHGSRYQFRRPSAFMDKVIGPLLFSVPPKWRVRVVQSFNGYVDMLLANMVRSLYETPDADPALAKRLRKFIARDKVTHLMMSFATTGPLALAAKRNSRQPFDYVLTFQGDEQFAEYARQAGLLPEFHLRMNEAVRASRWPAIAVSKDYQLRIQDEMGVPGERLRVVYNGVEFPEQRDKPPFSILKSEFPDLVESVAIVSFVGRQDSEKGIDLLLYAARLLWQRGIPLQLVICGATAKGGAYKKSISDLAGHLGLVVHHCGSVSSEVRDALYAHSRCVVYPSVNREAFGLVVAEAMSHGTPTMVPDHGGVTEVIQDGERAGGLTFRTWDSGDLARQLERMLIDEKLHDELAGNAVSVAERFTADRMTDNILAHVGIPAGEGSQGPVAARSAVPV